MLLAAAVGAMAISVFAVVEIQRRAASSSFDQTVAVERMQEHQLDMETGLRGYLQFARDDFLAPYRFGEPAFDRALLAARQSAGDDAELLENLDRQSGLSRTWRERAQSAVTRRRSRGAGSITPESALRRKAVMDRFRAANAEGRRLVAQRREASAGRAGAVSVLVIVALSALSALIGHVAIVRPARLQRRQAEAEADHRRTQREFTETLQVMGSEEEAYGLLKLHLQRGIPDAEVVIMNRNNSGDRLEAATPVEPASALTDRLLDAGPKSCLAVRLARLHEQGADADPLLRCELCGTTGANATCVPSLVGGQVIGSVLVRHEDPLSEGELRRLEESVGQAAPVLSTLRTLAIAETRAATDVLSNLPNHRACSDTLKRMVAQASRSLEPLVAIMMDLDHFKRINDRFGHAVGDDVLAAVGEVLRTSLRASDFAGRYGGEEFLVLLPSTTVAPDSAGIVAEKLRAAIAKLDVRGLGGHPVSASFGLASYPEHALDADSLVRMADRALYVAKGAGRDRVEVAAVPA